MRENVIRTIEMSDQGHNTVVLQERSCVNCSRHYRVMVSSTQMTCSKQCQIDAELDPQKRRLAVQQIATIKQAKKPPDPRFHRPAVAVAVPKPKEPTPLEIQEQKWKRYVEEAKQIVTSLNSNRMRIARMALEVCDIQQGGGAHWSDFEDVFTLKKFAEEIGVTYKTLHGWCRVLTNVVDKLPEGVFDESTDFAAARNTANRTKKTDSPQKVLSQFEKWKKRGNQDHYLLQIHRRMKSASYFIHNRAKLEKLDVEILKELQNNCQSVVNDINQFFRGDR